MLRKCTLLNIFAGLQRISNQKNLVKENTARRVVLTLERVNLHLLRVTLELG